MGKNKGTISVIILASLVALIIGIIFVYKNQITNQPQVVNNSPSPSTQDLKTFQSKVMKFSIDLPNNFIIKDETSRISINSPNGQIYINRNGTQYNNLEAYLGNFDEKTNLKITIDEKININNNEARKRIIQDTDVSDEEKIYFIYSDNYIYKLSTVSRSLYDDLDQIAQSFRYTP